MCVLYSFNGAGFLGDENDVETPRELGPDGLHGADGDGVRVSAVL